jgi:uncharacterized protein YceH (UPF0502 family)
MSQEPETWLPIPPYERRVLGVLIEKQKTQKSFEAYPMTLNAITVGCNQKSNRDPVYEMDEDVVEDALRELQQRGIVVKMTGSRVDRYRHQLYELWRVSPVQMAILAELLLRGPQTEGELRGRASRMDEIADLETLRRELQPLVARNLVVYLSPPERRGAQLTHGFHTAEEFAEAKHQASQAVAAPITASESPHAAPRGLGPLEAKLAELAAELEALKHRVARLEQSP